MNIKELLQDNSGGTSSMRVLLLAAFLVVGAVWCYVAVTTKSLPEIPAGVVTVLGTLTAAKAAQRFGEKSE